MIWGFYIRVITIIITATDGWKQYIYYICRVDLFPRLPQLSTAAINPTFKKGAQSDDNVCRQTGLSTLIVSLLQFYIIHFPWEPLLLTLATLMQATAFS